MRDLCIQYGMLIWFHFISSFFCSYYGIVVVPDPISDFKLNEANFDDSYPNVQPFDLRGDNEHYITVAWNNMSAIPEDFVIGDKTTTTAIRSGIEETYLNAELDANTMHCMYVLIHYSTDGSDVSISTL